MRSIIMVCFLYLFPNFILAQDFEFLGFKLDMTKEELISAVSNESSLIIKGDTLLHQLVPENPYTFTIDSRNERLIKKIFIDFYQQKSYQITIFLQPEYFTFFTLSEKLQDKYGIPTERNSIKVTWFDQQKKRRLTLEYPASIKITDYMKLLDVVQFQRQEFEKENSESFDYKERQRILDEL